MERALMHYYKHPETGEVFAYESEEDRERFGDPSLVPMTELEIIQHLNANNLPGVPQVVSRFQARAALHMFGILGQADELMSAPETDALKRLAWTDAQEFRRSSPTVIEAAQALGLSEEVLDNMFRYAAGIEA
jgi:hypothetical protein